MAAQRAIAIDIGRRRLRVVEADLDRASMTVRSILVEPLPEGLDPDDRQAIGAWVGRTLRAAGLGKLPATLAISREHVVLKRLTLPSTDRDELPAMTRLALQRNLPFDSGDAVIDFACVDHGAISTTVIAVAAPEPVLASVRDAARSAGLNVERMSLRTMGTAALIATSVTEGSPTGVLAVDISGGHVEFTVIVDGVIRFSRAGACPAGDDPQAIADAVLTEARRTWMSYRIVDDSEDVRRAVVFGDRRVCDIVTGSIGKTLNIEAETFDRHALVDTSRADVDMGQVWPLAGLLLAPMLDRELIDFLHPRKTPDIAGRRRRLIAGIAGALVILVLAGVTLARFDLADRRERAENLQAQKQGLLAGYLRYGRDRYKLAHLQHWDSVDADWLDHLGYVVSMTPPADHVVLDSWTGTLAFGGVKFDRKTSRFSSPREIRIVVDGEASDRMTADAFRGLLVDTESYDISTTGADARSGRRLAWSFQYNLGTRDAAPPSGDASVAVEHSPP